MAISATGGDDKRRWTDDVARVGKIPPHGCEFVGDPRVQREVFILAMMFFATRWVRVC